MSELLKDLEPVEEPKAGFVCDDDQKAEWCLLQIRRANAEKERWKAHYADALKSVTATCDETIARMEQFLHGYFLTVPHKRTKTEENYPLPSGKIMLKAQNTTFDYDDEELIAWLKEHKGGQFIKVKEAVDWDSLKATLSVMGETVADDDAQIIPCITAEEHEPVFKVQMKK